MHIPVHLHQTVGVFGGKISKIPIPEYVNDAPTEIKCFIHSREINSLKVLVEQVGWSSVGHLPDCGSALLYG